MHIDDPQLILETPIAPAARFRPGVSEIQSRAVTEQVQGTIKREYSIVDRLTLIELFPGTSVFQALAKLRANPNVLYAEPDYYYHSLDVPNDPLFPQQWNLQKTRSPEDRGPDSDIDAQEVWTITRGSRDVQAEFLLASIFPAPITKAVVHSRPRAFDSPGRIG